MPDYRCPKHDRIFFASIDTRPPGSNKTDKLPAHPANGHPECPKCDEEAKDAGAKTVVSNV
jgi:hypothetical protein